MNPKNSPETSNFIRNSVNTIFSPLKKQDIPDKSKTSQEGYLRKRGQLNPLWKRRFFSIIDDVLYYFKTEKVE